MTSLAMAMEMEMDMRATRKRCAVSRARCSGGLCDVAGRAVCCPRIGDAPAAPAARCRRWTWLAVRARRLSRASRSRFRQRIALSAYGFYYGDVDVPVAQVDLSGSGDEVPDCDSQLPLLRDSAKRSQQERRPAGAVHRHVRGEPVSHRRDGQVLDSADSKSADRNMYVRRFRPTQMKSTAIAIESAIAHPFAVNGHIWKPFANHEAFYEWGNGGWNRNRLCAGATLPLQKHVSFQPVLHLGHAIEERRDVHYLQFGLIVSTR